MITMLKETTKCEEKMNREKLLSQIKHNLVSVEMLLYHKYRLPLINYCSLT